MGTFFPETFKLVNQMYCILQKYLHCFRFWSQNTRNTNKFKWNSYYFSFKKKIFWLEMEENLIIQSESEGAPAPWAKTTRGRKTSGEEEELSFLRVRFAGGGEEAAMDEIPKIPKP